MSLTFATGLVAMLTLVLLPAEGSGSYGTEGPVRSSEAKKKALAKCKKIKVKAKRRTCISQVNQRFLSPEVVDVRDDYFYPNEMTIRSGRRITWDWGMTNGNSHNVMLDPLLPQPKGLTRGDYFRLDTGQNYAIDKRFTRSLVKAGTYNFYCSLHSTVMRMKVKVKP